ncbi:hypothetical protein V3390_00245 [Luteimonas sp. FXH3W]|uniref:Transcriptional regulator n=1 Tax=Aquilutibacter rugosus TaxID=3115820 RepID=A0ABU7UVR1_9GAMM
MEIDHAKLLAILQDRHLGAANGATASQLVFEVCGGKRDAALERHLRSAIVELRRHGVPICATPGEGYFYATSIAELDQTCEFLFQRSMTSLEQVAALKNVALPDLAGQLGLQLQSTTTKGTSNE